MFSELHYCAAEIILLFFLVVLGGAGERYGYKWVSSQFVVCFIW